MFYTILNDVYRIRETAHGKVIGLGRRVFVWCLAPFMHSFTLVGDEGKQ